MIIKFFRSNQPALLLTVPLIGLFCWALHYFDQSMPDQPQGFLFRLAYSHFTLESWMLKTIALALICLTAIQVNTMLNEIEVFSKITHVTFLLTIVFGSILSHRGVLEPAMVANLFLVLSIRSVLKVYHQNSAISLTFDTGLYIGIASLFEPIYLLVLPIALIAVLTLRAADWREILFLFIGSFFPFAFLFSLLFFFSVSYEYPDYLFQNKSFRLPYSDSYWFLTYSIMLILLFLRSFLFYIGSLKGIAIRVKKQRNIILYFSLILICIYVILVGAKANYFPNQVLLLPVSFFMSFLVIHTSRPVLIDFYLYLITIIWLVFVYNLYFLS